jgi:hypothetical protein
MHGDRAVNSEVKQLRPVAATVCILAVVALAVSGCVEGQTRGPSGSSVAGSESSVTSNEATASAPGVIAWVDRPSTHYVAPSPSPDQRHIHAFGLGDWLRSMNQIISSIHLKK